MQSELTHNKCEQLLKEDMDWPQYYVSGEGVDAKNFVPAYYKVEGPNGPVSYKNPNSEAIPTTMFNFAMEAQSESFRFCKKENTPWAE